jgi:hypothetical protein
VLCEVPGRQHTDEPGGAVDDNVMVARGVGHNGHAIARSQDSGAEKSG